VAYLLFDIGSSSLKAAIITEEGRLLGLARRALSQGRAGAEPGRGRDAGALGREAGVHEADAAGWIEAAYSAGAEALTAARRASGEARLEIRAISVSGNGPTLLAVDASGEPLGPALAWMDRRALAEAEEVSALAGRVIDPSFYLPKALRLWREADPAGRSRLRWFFSCPEYLLFALCGTAITYLPHPGYEPYIWNAGMIEALGLPLDRFPPFAAPAARTGLLLPGAAGRLGLAPGIPLVAGFPDFLAAIVGSACVGIGSACDRSGTSEAINICAERPYPTRALLSLPHPVEGLWNVSGGVSTAGAALEWLAKALVSTNGRARESDGAGLLAEATLAPPGARGLVFLPYLAGERAPLWDSSRRAAFTGLSMDHGRPEMARAVCESLAYGLKLASDLAQAEGLPFDLLRVSGQAAGDDFLCGLKADILAVPVEAPEIADCELLGDAAACALSLGDASSLAESATSLMRVRRRFEPGASGAYAKAFESYKAALEALAAVDHRR
jgi:xylulokinase